mmetsp:Transcript_13025/g.23195  ORF Transcript_13025/g.23195 Transcript_13025/m.23195 type:complete len:204 (-) Transcript_13025:240-851(-)
MLETYIASLQVSLGKLATWHGGAVEQHIPTHGTGDSVRQVSVARVWIAGPQHRGCDGLNRALIHAEPSVTRHLGPIVDRGNVDIEHVLARRENPIRHGEIKACRRTLAPIMLETDLPCIDVRLSESSPRERRVILENIAASARSHAVHQLLSRSVRVLCLQNIHRHGNLASLLHLHNVAADDGGIWQVHHQRQSCRSCAGGAI